MRTLVSPESLKTLIIPSKLSAKPLKGLNSYKSVHPIQIPANREGITCFVLIAKIIAMIGGSTEYHCGSLIIDSLYPLILLRFANFDLFGRYMGGVDC